MLSPERTANAVAEQGQSLDGLVAEDESNVPIGDRSAPAAHRGGSDLLREQAVGELHAVETESSDVEKDWT